MLFKDRNILDRIFDWMTAGDREVRFDANGGVEITDKVFNHDAVITSADDLPSDEDLAFIYRRQCLEFRNRMEDELMKGDWRK